MRQNRYFLPNRVEQKHQSTSTTPPKKVAWQRFFRLYKRFQGVFLVVLGILITLAVVLVYSNTRPEPQRLTQRDIDAAVGRALASATPAPSYASQSYEMIRPSLVQIKVLNLKLGGGTEGALGSGVVIDDSGIILTALHVVNNAFQIRVVFADGTESEARVIARQPENDIAVLRANVIPDDLMPATLAGSGSLHVGDEVFAVGNPFGIVNSLTAGVVSGLNRTYQSEKTGGTLSNLIQFDAAVNPGNSGGPLLNRNGEVVGIVSSLLNPNNQDFFIGIGLAVPIESAAAAAGSPPY